MAVDEAKLEEFIGTFLGDMGAAMSFALVGLGDRLGLYRAMAGSGPVTPEELARRTATPERYIRAWLANQAASGYVTYNSATGAYTLPEEQAMVLGHPDSPVLMVGAADVTASVYEDREKILRAYMEGTGFGWHEHSQALFHGTERFFRPGYVANLTTAWMPALEGVQEKLRAGAKVADVGCGHGASTIVMAQAYPASTFAGFDYHTASIDEARKVAADAGVGDQVTFTVAPADSYPGSGYDLVCLFDSLHDMGDPAAALRHIRSGLDPEGCVLLVEPQAGERVEDNLNPVGRLFYAAAATVCIPNAASQTGDAPLHTQSPESAHRRVAKDAGIYPLPEGDRDSGQSHFRAAAVSAACGAAAYGTASPVGRCSGKCRGYATTHRATRERNIRDS